MSVQIHDCEQGSPEWRQLRAGLPTASNFADILAKGEGKVRRAYLLRLAGEKITGEPAETYTNANMDRGKAMEGPLRDRYAFRACVEPVRVGFITNGAKGCSPDSLINQSGALEIKSAFPHIVIDRILRGGFPPEHRAQCQGVLWVAEREWIDLALGWPGVPLYVVREHRDEAYISNLADEVDRFNDELALTVERVRAYGSESLRRVAA